MALASSIATAVPRVCNVSKARKFKALYPSKVASACLTIPIDEKSIQRKLVVFHAAIDSLAWYEDSRFWENKS